MTLTGTCSDDLVLSGRDFPTNCGGLRQKGRTSAELPRMASRTLLMRTACGEPVDPEQPNETGPERRHLSVIAG
jgi:hypothetical protein